MRRMERGRPSTPRTGPVMEVEILEEGRTGYLRINRMINTWEDIYIPLRGKRSYEIMVDAFANYIADFDNLIIDLRGNPGGHHTHFDQIVLPKFMHRYVAYAGYVLYTDGHYSRLSQEMFMNDRYLHGDYWGRDGVIRQRVVSLANTPVAGAEDFSLAFRVEYVVRPSQSRRRWIGGFNRDVGFSGKTWLLVDGRTASGAEAASALLKYSQAATLVGEPTMGIIGTTYTPDTILMSLPNTGILVRFDIAYYTCPQGHPLQGYGITPHFPNREGLDALETVLAMIDEAR
jgi:C-terminal processing protease CtpA/Prc